MVAKMGTLLDDTTHNPADFLALVGVVEDALLTSLNKEDVGGVGFAAPWLDDFIGVE